MSKIWFVAIVATGIATSAFAQELLTPSTHGTASESCGDAGGWAVDLAVPIVRKKSDRIPLADREIFVKLNGGSLKDIAGYWSTTMRREGMGNMRASVAPKGGWPHVFASRGSITVTRVTETVVEGTWDLVFDDLLKVERVHGPFTVTIRRWADIIKPGTRVVCQ